MRKLIGLFHITLDGVIQGPGAPDEDTSNDFKYGGWAAPFGDDKSDAVLQRLMAPADLLLGRKTFEIWENYWPLHADVWPGINEVSKYVVSAQRHSSKWNNSLFLKDIDEVSALKRGEGGDIKLWGSSELMQSLMARDLVDEIWLLINPITIGNGKRLFGSGTIPATFRLLEGIVTPSGLIIAHYERNGAVVTGRADQGHD